MTYVIFLGGLFLSLFLNSASHLKGNLEENYGIVLIAQSCLTLCNLMDCCLSMEFSRQKYWSGLPFPSPGDLPDPGIKTRSLALQVDSLPSELSVWYYIIRYGKKDLWRSLIKLWYSLMNFMEIVLKLVNWNYQEGHSNLLQLIFNKKFSLT